MEKNGDAGALLDGKPATMNQGEPLSSNAARRNSTRPLRNWKHEKFAQLVAGGTEPGEAYVLAGFTRSRANHNRLMRHLKDRIDMLRRERDMAARAARVPISQVLEELDRRGLARIDDFFEHNAAGIVTIRDLKAVPVEVSIAFLRILGESFGIRES
jgi:hypothetical protein